MHSTLKFGLARNPRFIRSESASADGVSAAGRCDSEGTLVLQAARMLASLQIRLSQKNRPVEVPMIQEPSSVSAELWLRVELDAPNGSKMIVASVVDVWCLASVPVDG